MLSLFIFWWALKCFWSFIDTTLTEISWYLSVSLAYCIIILAVFRGINGFQFSLFIYREAFFFNVFPVVPKIAFPIILSAGTKLSSDFLLKILIIPTLGFPLSSYVFNFLTHHTSIIISVVELWYPIFIIGRRRPWLMHSLTYSLM